MQTWTQPKQTAALHSKLERKFNTICLSLASDASEILPSVLQSKNRLVTKHMKTEQKWKKITFCCPEAFNLLDSCQQVLVLTQDVLQEGLLKLGDFAWLHFVQVSPHTSINDCHLFFNGHWSCENTVTVWDHTHRYILWNKCLVGLGMYHFFSKALHKC